MPVTMISGVDLLMKPTAVFTTRCKRKERQKDAAAGQTDRLSRVYPGCGRPYRTCTTSVDLQRARGGFVKPKGSQAARAATADRRARKHGGGKKTSASAASAASQPSEPCERSEHSRERSERSEPARERSEPASASAASLPRTSAASLRVHSLDETDRLLKDVPTTIVAAGGARGRRDHRLLGQAIAFSCAGGEIYGENAAAACRIRRQSHLRQGYCGACSRLGGQMERPASRTIRARRDDDRNSARQILKITDCTRRMHTSNNVRRSARAAVRQGASGRRGASSGVCACV